ncbi:K(+) efflux antiporter 2 [Spatholobus suberectus]|nr:K(+) efflux antiporter 2 [Spatholobus suberectus]
MDVAFRLSQSNVVLDGLDSCIVFGGRGFGCAFLGNSRTISKARFSGMNKIGSRSGLRVECVGELRASNGKRGLSWKNNKLSRGNREIWSKCQGNDSLAYVNGNGRNVDKVEGAGEDSDLRSISSAELVEPLGDKEQGQNEVEVEVQNVDELKELLQKAMKELQAARVNSIMFEEKVKKISETAISLQDEAASAWNNVTSTLDVIQDIVSQEFVAKEAVQKATMALSLAEAKLQVAIDSLEVTKEVYDSPQGSNKSNGDKDIMQEEKELLVAQEDMRECQTNLANCENELRCLQCRKEELQNEVNNLHEIAEQAQLKAAKAEEDVANIMLLAEQAVAAELEAAQLMNDAEIALQKADKFASSFNADTKDTLQVQDIVALPEEEKVVQGFSGDDTHKREVDFSINDEALLAMQLPETQSDNTSQSLEDMAQSDYLSDHENGQLSLDSYKEAEVEIEKSKNVVQTKKQETQKTRDNSLVAPKTLLKKSSRFFPASFFSFTADETDYTPASVFHGLVDSAQKQLPKLVVGLLLIGAGVVFYANRTERSAQLLQQPEVIATTVEEVSSTAKPLVRQLQELPRRIKKIIASLPDQEVNEEEASLFDMLWLLLASVVFVPIFQKIPGGSPVLGYLAAGILIGPYGLSIIRHVHGTKAIAEFGVVFLLFNIGLELSVERLSSMKKYVFGLGSAQVLVTAVVVGLVAHYICGQAGPAAIVIGNGLALSSTAVVLQVLQERGESTSRHGRAAFSVLLFQDLAVVVLLILIPLVSPNSSKGGVGFQAIAEALGLAAVKAVVAITAIIAGGRLLLRPIYKQIAENQNAEIFSANTLFVILGTSLLTARAGLSMALGAFLAGLLLAETEFSLQVESDIAPYRGLLLGLFFMTVGMSIDPKLLVSNFPVITGTLGLLICGKTLLVSLIGRIFGISLISAIRVGLLLAPGGEFAFVAFGEAVNQGIMSSQLSSLLFLVVGISMALTPWLAAGGQLLASRFELHDVRSLLPVESETDDLQNHIIICGFGRVGQIIAQLLSEQLIPFVALDVRSDRVAIGRSLDLPVYFGDAGNREVLHKVGAERASAAAVTLDSPGANYRTVWALSKYFPNVKTFVRAHDVDHGLNLEKAGATAVVPETLEPSLQLAAAVLAQAKLPASEIAATINEFRSRHLAELTELSETNGTSFGYGYNRIASKPKPPSPDSSDGTQLVDGVYSNGFRVAIEDWRVIECCKEDYSVNRMEMWFSFKHGYPSGIRLSKNFNAKVKEWQRLPNVGPYVVPIFEFDARRLIYSLDRDSFWVLFGVWWLAKCYRNMMMAGCRPDVAGRMRPTMMLRVLNKQFLGIVGDAANAATKKPPPPPPLVSRKPAFIDAFLYKMKKNPNLLSNKTIWSRRSTILPEFVDTTVKIYNGKTTIRCRITEGKEHDFGMLRCGCPLMFLLLVFFSNLADQSPPQQNCGNNIDQSQTGLNHDCTTTRLPPMLMEKNLPHHLPQQQNGGNTAHTQVAALSPAEYSPLEITNIQAGQVQLPTYPHHSPPQNGGSSVSVP